MKKLRTNNDLEFCNQKFENFYAAKGIIRHRIMRLTPQQNRLAKKINRTLIEKVRCMFIKSKLLKSLWVEILLATTYLVNLSPSLAIGFKIPFEMWYGKPASYDNLRVFGCPAYTHIDQGKLELRTLIVSYPE